MWRILYIILAMCPAYAANLPCEVLAPLHNPSFGSMRNWLLPQLNFELIQQSDVIMTGSMGKVIVVDFGGTDRKIALKLNRSPNEDMDNGRTLVEVTLLMKLQGVGAPRLYQFDLNDHAIKGNPYISYYDNRYIYAMEYLPGHDLERMLLHEKQLFNVEISVHARLQREISRIRRLLHWVRAAAVVMDRAHSMHVIHQDIKPENIMVHGEHLWMIDWGFGVDWDNWNLPYGANWMSSLVKKGMLVGSPSYISPEAGQLIGSVNISPEEFLRTGRDLDRYALTQTFAELIFCTEFFNKVPIAFMFKAKNEFNILTLHRELANIPRTQWFGMPHVELLKFISRNLSPDPYVRAVDWKTWQSAFVSALLMELNRLEKIASREWTQHTNSLRSA